MNDAFSKISLRVLLAVATWLTIHAAHAMIIADGRGIARVAVTVTDSKTLLPLQGATLTMKDAGAEAVTGDDELKSFSSMFNPQRTSAYGDAFVYYFGRFSSQSDSDGKAEYRREVRGTLLIELDGYKPVTIDLSKVIGTVFNSRTAIPLLEVMLEQKTK